LAEATEAAVTEVEAATEAIRVRPEAVISAGCAVASFFGTAEGGREEAMAIGASLIGGRTSSPLQCWNTPPRVGLTPSVDGSEPVRKRGFVSNAFRKIDLSAILMRHCKTMSHHILYIGATWCGPCKRIQPQIEELAKRYGVPIRLLDLDEMEEKDKEMITKVPTIVTFVNEKQSARYETNHVASVTEWLSKNVSLTTTDF
jgi:thioredoxin 1